SMVGWCRVRRRHLRHHAIALAIERLQEPLAPPAVSNRLAHGFDRTLECGVADELLGPDLLAQLLLGDDPVGMDQHIGQDLKHLAPQPVDAPGAGQLRALRIEGTLAEDVQHRGTPSFAVTALTPHSARAAAMQATGVGARARAPARSVPLPPR